ncbi:MAG: glucokinase [Azoarcus sp.]|jgi:glucokinase|nr:glucokinase [Azoarcus sp.]
MRNENERIVLAADIGGSRARLLLARARQGQWQAERRHEARCADYAGFEALLEDFLADAAAPVAACLAIAGPVKGRRIRMTNLPWVVDADALTARFGIAQVRLINDFAAQAHGLADLAADGLVVLQAGEPQPEGVRALIGPGTGLGMAALVGALDDPRVLPSQGGLADFAPRDARQLALAGALLAHHGRVSSETLLCGRGIERLYRFVAGLPPDAALTLDAPAIGAAALAGEARAAEALRLFATLLAQAAANVALTLLPRGGIYISGGIAPRVLPFLLAPEVVEVFRDHPEMGEVLARIPLYVVRDDALGLKGAARIAAGMARDER